MPKVWTNKEERQYEHIRDSAEERGTPERQAKELAARTVNKHRREQGKTRNVRPQGTGNPNKPLEEHTRDELYNQAKSLHIEGRSTMNKRQLIDAIQAANH